MAKIEVLDFQVERGPSGGILQGRKYPVVMDGLRGEVRVARDARDRNPREQYSENEVRQAVGQLVALEVEGAHLVDGFTLYLTKANAASVGLVWRPRP